MDRLIQPVRLADDPFVLLLHRLAALAGYPLVRPRPSFLGEQIVHEVPRDGPEHEEEEDREQNEGHRKEQQPSDYVGSHFAL